MAKKQTGKRAAQPTSARVPEEAVSSYERIALLAYSYWERRGCTGGSPEEDWFRAEREILGQDADSRR